MNIPPPLLNMFVTYFHTRQIQLYVIPPPIMFAHCSFVPVVLCRKAVFIYLFLYFGFLQEQYSSWDSSVPSTHTFFSLHLHWTLSRSFISASVFALVTEADYAGLSSFCPSDGLCPRSVVSFRLRAASPDGERQSGEIEWEENQPSKMNRFATGVKVCVVSTSCHSFSSPLFL